MKRKIIFITFILSISILIIGCQNNGSDKMKFVNIEDAISYGLEYIEATEVLRTTVSAREIFILYTRDDGESIGAGVVKETDEGYEWTDEMPSFIAEYVVGDLNTEDGQKYIIVGKTADANTKQVKITGIDFERVVDVYNGHYIAVDLPNKNIMAVEPL